MVFVFPSFPAFGKRRDTTSVNGKIAVTCVRRVFILTVRGQLREYSIRISDYVKTAVSGNYAGKRCAKALRNPLFDRPNRTAKNYIIIPGPNWNGHNWNWSTTVYCQSIVWRPNRVFQCIYLRPDRLKQTKVDWKTGPKIITYLIAYGNGFIRQTSGREVSWFQSQLLRSL